LYNCADLKSFFTTISSSGSAPSIRQSASAAVSGEAQPQGGTAEPEPSPRDVAAGGTDEPEPSPTDAAVDTDAPFEDAELIKVFNSDIHVISDPALCFPIEKFHHDIRANVQRAYLLRGPTKPFAHTFPRKPNDNRAFLASWLKNYDWLEYSVVKDATFCFYCFRFRQEPLDEKI